MDNGGRPNALNFPKPFWNEDKIEGYFVGREIEHGSITEYDWFYRVPLKKSKGVRDCGDV